MTQKLLLLQNFTDKFALMADLKGNQYIVSEFFDLFIKVKKYGYIPRSGFALIQTLENFQFERKSALDIGCGETGIIAHYLRARNATKVTGLDIDYRVIDHAKNCSNKSTEIDWIVSNLFENIHNQYDVITCNPPQMPTPIEVRKSLKDLHDSPGDSGQETINEILKQGKIYLNKDGVIIMIIFDFLGIMESYNSKPSIKDNALAAGFQCETIASLKQKIRPGGKTEQNLDWIKFIYPKYVFNKDGEGYYHQVHIVKFHT